MALVHTRGEAKYRHLHMRYHAVQVRPRGFQWFHHGIGHQQIRLGGMEKWYNSKDLRESRPPSRSEPGIPMRWLNINWAFNQAISYQSRPTCGDILLWNTYRHPAHR